jgi:hypothetical protein
VEPCESLEILLCGFVDGELSPAEHERVRQHLTECHGCALKVIAMNAMREHTKHVQFQDPPPEEWDEHAKGLFETAGRGLGWLFYIVGFVLYLILIVSALWECLVDREPGWGFVLVVFSLLAGTVWLFTAVFYQRLRARATDRYKDIVR